jgi:glycosyltransferase involved in cell wall biosynthesis
VHVALDASAVVPGLKGLGRFQARLLAELARRAPDGVRGTLLGQPGFAAAGAQVPEGWRVETLRASRSIARELVEVPRLLRGVAPEVYLTTTDRLRAPRGVPVLLYVFEDPGRRRRMPAADSANGPRQRVVDRVADRWFSRSLRAAAHVVAASTSTARELVEARGLEQSRVTVATPGPFQDPAPWRGPSDADPAVLVFIDRDVRDNGAVALRAFAQAGPGWRLDVVGDTDPRVVSLAGELGVADRVAFHGRVSDEQVRSAYGAAQIYLDVSLHEGFGAQAVEAATAGVPSVVSRVDALPEVTQERAVYVDPEDVEDVAAALRRLMDSPEERARAGAAFDEAELAGRWPALVDALLDRCRALAAG